MYVSVCVSVCVCVRVCVCAVSDSSIYVVQFVVQYSLQF